MLELIQWSLFILISDFPGTSRTQPEPPWTATDEQENTVHARYTHHAGTGAPLWNRDTIQTFLLSLWIELRFCIHQDMISMASGKILLAKTKWFFREKSLIFDWFFAYSLRSTCHSTCPLPQRILLYKRTSRLYESLPHACAALILRQQAILRFQSAPAAWKSLRFMKF